MAGFVHIWPKIGLKQPMLIVHFNTNHCKSQLWNNNKKGKKMF